MITVAVDFSDFPKLLSDIVSTTLSEAPDVEVLEIDYSNFSDRRLRQADVFLVSAGSATNSLRISDLSIYSDIAVLAIQPSGNAAQVYQIKTEYLSEPTPDSILEEIRRASEGASSIHSRIGPDG